MRGQATEAIIHLRDALAQAQTKGTLGRPYGHCLLAQALAHRGDYRDAMVALNEAFERIETTGERGWEFGALSRARVSADGAGSA